MYDCRLHKGSSRTIEGLCVRTEFQYPTERRNDHKILGTVHRTPVASHAGTRNNLALHTILVIGPIFLTFSLVVKAQDI